MPDYRELLLDQIALSAEGKRTRRSVGINFPQGRLFGVVRQAAQGRGMSMAAFVRRAALAVAAWDLDLDWDTLMAEEPGIRAFDHTMTEEHDAPRAGRGHGPWIIRGMGEADGERGD